MSRRSPAVILYDAAGVALAVADGVAIPASTKALLVVGSEGGTARYLRVAADGTLRTDPTGTTAQPVTDNGGSLTVDATSLPLPTGAATEATLAAIKAKTDNIPASPSQEHATAGSPSSARLSDGAAFYDAAKTGQLPAALVGGRLDQNVGAWLGSTAPTVGQKTMANSVPVALSSDQSAIPVEGRANDGAAPVGKPVLVAGSDDTNVQTIKTDTQGRLVVVSPTGSSSGFAAGNAVLATTTVSPVRATTYTEQTTDAQRSIVSSSASDTAAGTGVRSVRITYYTATLTGPNTEDINLNGTTPVNTVNTDICFIEKIEALTVGSGGVAAGIISLKAATAGGGATIWSIAAGDTATRGAHHYVPTGQTAKITGLLIGIKGADTTSGFLRAQKVLTSNSVDEQISDVIRAPSSGQSLRTYGTPIRVVGPARIAAWAAPDSSSSRTYYASFDYYEEAS